MTLPYFMRKIIALFLILPLFSMSIAQARTSNMMIYSLIQHQMIREQVLKFKSEFEKVKSWEEMKEEIKKSSMDESEKIWALEHVKQHEQEPFRKPALIVEENGFSLSAQGEKLTFDLLDKKVRYMERTFHMEGKSPEDLLRWLKEDNKFSFMSFFISEAHAIVGGLLILVIPLIFIAAAFFDAFKDNCLHSLERAKKKIHDSYGTCQQDETSKHVSINTQLLLDTIDNGTLMKIVVRNYPNNMTCEQLISTTYKRGGKFCGSPGDEAQMCKKLNLLDKCLKKIVKMPTHINNSGRHHSLKDLPRAPAKAPKKDNRQRSSDQ